MFFVFDEKKFIPWKKLRVRCPYLHSTHSFATCSVFLKKWQKQKTQRIFNSFELRNGLPLCCLDCSIGRSIVFLYTGEEIPVYSLLSSAHKTIINKKRYLSNYY